MRIETVTASSKQDAEDICPWAAEIIEVDSGDDTSAWMCFESVDDYRQWLNQLLGNPNAATDLQTLCDILNAWAAWIAESYQHGQRDDDYPCDLTSLPKFGDDWANPPGVYSWDETHMLVEGDQITVNVTGWAIIERNDT